MSIIWIPIIELAIGIPIALAIHASKERAERSEQEAEEREHEKKREGAYCHLILFKALRDLQRNGTGGHLITAALRSRELDSNMALAAVQLTRRDAERWCGTSTEDGRNHLNIIKSILSNAEKEITALNLE